MNLTQVEKDAILSEVKRFIPTHSRNCTFDSGSDCNPESDYCSCRLSERRNELFNILNEKKK